MRYAILSDIHGNAPALQAVLHDAGRQKAEAYVCLGDTVGYGPRPAWCLRTLLRLGAHLIAGNHDQAAAGTLDYGNFNHAAGLAMDWTRKPASGLLPEDYALLRGLPMRSPFGTHAVACHGTPSSVVDYVAHRIDAAEALSTLKRDFPEARHCFFGHTHRPICWSWNLDRQTQPAETRLVHDVPLALDPQALCLINPGSVGQPRDRDPRAAWLLYDDVQRTVTLRRVAYDIHAAQAGFRAARLPESLAERLAHGR